LVLFEFLFDMDLPTLFPAPEPEVSIKICGVTLPEQAEPIVAAGAAALGINFWPKSRRYVAPEVAMSWLPGLRDRIHLVAVLVNASDELIEQVLPLVHTLQFHGDETPQRVAEWMGRGVRVIKALQVRDEASLEPIAAFPCEHVLLDAYNPTTYGGEGHRFPWHLAVLARRQFPQKQLLLSGGLRPDNVRQAIEQTGIHALDVASGVESGPGVKDLEKVRLLIEQAG
jgi:phosphoribosylanthranilate isomerase